MPKRKRNTTSVGISAVACTQDSMSSQTTISLGRSKTSVPQPPLPETPSSLSDESSSGLSTSNENPADDTIDLTADGDESADDECIYVDSFQIAPKRSRRSDSPAPEVIAEIARPTVIQPPQVAPLPPAATPTTAEALKCPVCLDSFEIISSDETRKLVTTKCGHLFCEGCIKDSISGSKQCPTCRGRLATAKTLTRIYL